MIRRTAISFSGPTSRHPKEAAAAAAAAAAAVFKTITVTQVAVGVAAATALVAFRNQDVMRILVQT